MREKNHHPVTDWLLVCMFTIVSETVITSDWGSFRFLLPLPFVIMAWMIERLKWLDHYRIPAQVFDLGAHFHAGYLG